ncbi:MAG: phosphotransferase [Bacteroidaceae bacterium]|nr:phosphotransferase [Bacteroidaceae bacterium]
METLKQLYIDTFHVIPQSVETLKAAGSNRQYVRFTDSEGQSAIGVIGTSVQENNAFVTISRHFREKNLPVPEVYAISKDGLRYIQQDLGSRSLFDALRDGRENGGNYGQNEIQLLRKVIRMLPEIQFRGAEGLDWKVCYPQPEFDEENIHFDLNYFKYCFLKATEIDFHERLLEADFRALTGALLNDQSQAWGFMYRDFQARNIMLDDNDNPWFIDFQGGRRGPLYYDLASFLWQASASYGEKIRETLIDDYYDRLNELVTDGCPCVITELPSRTDFQKQLSLFALFRLLQVLGAYGFRGYFQRKQHFIDSITPAIKSLKKLIADNDFPFPYLLKILNGLIDKQLSANDNTLTVRIFSFSYKRGIPEDCSGNGGGYVFDCRATHNPGRYEPFKKLTGLDEPVIRFLEEDGEILSFLDSVYQLADSHIKRYIQRQFTSLMFSFGCTGGQHRSVYAAQHLADHIRENFPTLKVVLTHREQQRPRALVLAAGLGTRLKPITDTMPKALVRVGGSTLLERTIETLRKADIANVVVNVHHFAGQIKDFLANHKLMVKTDISDETQKLLDTGGALLHARPLFNTIAPVLIHNVDIISNADIPALLQCSEQTDSSATLLVSSRETTRYLVFDDDGNLTGWKNVKTGETKGSVPVNARKYAFSGIHVVKQEIFPLLQQYSLTISDDRFSIIDFYLWACSRTNIRCFIQNDLQLTDVGKIQTLQNINDNC